MKKLNVCIIFGGKSGEHEVSLRSAKSIYEAIDKNKYNVSLLGITKTGSMHYLESEPFKQLSAVPENEVETSTSLVKRESSWLSPVASLIDDKEMKGVDIFFPIIHGTYGEDGSLQGMLEMLDVAYVGAGVLGSAIGMDKDVMKRLLVAAKLPVSPYKVIRKQELNSLSFDNLLKSFTLPVFVKPANLGSSVGISKVTQKDEFEAAIRLAFKYDTKVLIEQGVAFEKEIEISVLGNENPEASVAGEVNPKGGFYSYENKYIDPDGAELVIPAKIPEEKTKEAQQLAIAAFQTLECSGMARVDFFYTKEGDLILNEINTLPGFTSISMYPKLWEATGLSYSDLIDKLLQLALARKEQLDLLKRDYS